MLFRSCIADDFHIISLGVLTGLRVGKALGVKNLLLQSNSKLVVGQIKGKFEVKEEMMQKCLRLTRLLT